LTYYPNSGIIHIESYYEGEQLNETI